VRAITAVPGRRERIDVEEVLDRQPQGIKVVIDLAA